MSRVLLPEWFFRAACLFTAAANMGGNLALLLFYRPLLGWLRVPLPADPYTFSAMSLLSFTMGFGALLAFLHPRDNEHLLKVGIVGKGTFAAVTWYFYAAHHLHWFWLAFGAYDAVFVGVFFLYLMRVVAPDLALMQRGDVMRSLPRPPSNDALVLTYSLTKNGSHAVDRLCKGLADNGYKVHVARVVAQEPLFRFPMSFWDFVRIIVRAGFRVRTRVAPLEVPPDRDFDLVVFEAPTWLLGMAAPAEAVFEDDANARLFEGRDAAALVICRGAWRRTQAMIVRWLQARRANVVAARGFTHKGAEPSRLFTLWAYLISKGAPSVAERYGLSEETLAQVETFGADLARRARSSPGQRSAWAHALSTKGEDYTQKATP